MSPVVRNTLYGTLFFLVFLTGVVSIIIYRTARLAYETPSVEQVEYDEIEITGAVKRLSKGLQFRTISTREQLSLHHTEFEAFIDYLAESYPGIHNKLSLELINDYTLVFKWEGSSPDLPAAMFQGHYDVVPVEPGTEENWTYSAFDGTIADGYVWGRGAIDDKSGVFSYLEALEHLIEEGFKPQRTVFVVLNHDEEIGGLNGARKVADRFLEQGQDIAFLVDEGMPIAEEILEGLEHPIAMIGVAEKGNVSIELQINKEGGHSSMPPRITSIGELSLAIRNLKDSPMEGRFTGLLRETFEPVVPDLPFLYRMALSNLWLFGGIIEERLGYIPHTNAALRTTIAPTMFNAGIKENVLPQTARAIVNFRIHPNDSIESVLNYVRNTIVNENIQIRILEGGREPSPVSSSMSEPFQAMKFTIHEIFPDIPVAPSMFLAATDARHFTEVSEHLLRFRPIRARPMDRTRIHGTDERISLVNFKEMIAFHIRLIKNTTGNEYFVTH
ncbi:MAG: M20 family peptidase [Balneolales bacterium]